MSSDETDAGDDDLAEREDETPRRASCGAARARVRTRDSKKRAQSGVAGRGTRGHGTAVRKTRTAQLPEEAAFSAADGRVENQPSRGDTRRAEYNRGPLDIATLAIFPEYLEFEGQEVVQLVFEGAAGKTAT